MRTADLKHLRDLENRATRDKVMEEGSGNVVIYAAELHALREAIKEIIDRR